MKVTVYNDTIGTGGNGTKYETYTSYSASAAINSVAFNATTIGAVGTSYYLESVAAANVKANADTIALTSDITVYVGYVKATAAPVDFTATTTATTTWSKTIAANDYVKVGDTVTGTITFAEYLGAAGAAKTITASGAGTGGTYTGTATVTKQSDNSAVTVTINNTATTSTRTYAIAQTDSVDGTISVVFKFGTTDIALSLAYFYKLIL